MGRVLWLAVDAHHWEVCIQTDPDIPTCRSDQWGLTPWDLLQQPRLELVESGLSLEK